MRKRLRGGLKPAAYACLAVVAAGLQPCGALAQDTQPTFRATVRLIVQSVIVKDRQGRPVPGLTAKDFVVTEDGQPQEIAFVEYQAFDTGPAGSPAEAPGAKAGAAGTTGTTGTAGVASVIDPRAALAVPGDARFRGRRLLVLYFDTYQMTLFDQYRAFAGADKYLTSLMTPADLAAVLMFDGRGVQVKQAFTDDRAALRNAIQELVSAADEKAGGGAIWDPGGAFGENDDTFNLFATDRQLAALQTAVTDLGPLPELKTLVYFGSGLQLTGTDNLAQLRATVNAAVRANVTLNPVDTRGLSATPPLGDASRPSPGGVGLFSGTIAQASVTRTERSRDALYALAKDTGGRAMFDNNDLSLGIVEAAQAVTGYYMLGYYSRNIATDGRFRRVKVSLAAGLDAELSYRAGYYGDKDFSKFNAADKERQLAEALKLDDPITEIPMAAEVNYFQLSRAEYFVPVSVRMPGSELARSRERGASRVDIDLIGEIKDEHGVTIRNVRDRVQIPLGSAGAAASRLAGRAIQYETAFSVLPGTYVIKLLARNDATGRIGTLQAPFVVPNLEREQTKLRISSVVLSNQRVGANDTLYTVKQKIPAETANPLVHAGQKLIPSVTRVFNAGGSMFVLLEAYEPDATAVRPIVAFVTLSRDGVSAYETAPVAVRDWNPRTRVVPIQLDVPLATLAPGKYDCQITALDPASNRAAFWRASIVIR